jgi:putative transcriptional regulator
MMRKRKKKDDRSWPSVTDAVRETLTDIGKVIDNKQTMREFDALQFEPPKDYGAKEIVHLRTRKLRMSQAVFARACNIRLGTLQKYERGARKPTPPVNRLLQLVERDGLKLVTRR